MVVDLAPAEGRMMSASHAEPEEKRASRLFFCPISWNSYQLIQIKGRAILVSHSEGRSLAACVYCHQGTQVYLNSVPVCIQCLSTRKPAAPKEKDRKAGDGGESIEAASEAPG